MVDAPRRAVEDACPYGLDALHSSNQRDFDYQKARDAEDDRRWQAEFDYRAAQDALAAAAKSGKSGGGSSKKKKTVTLSAPAASAAAGGSLGALALLKGVAR